MTFSISPTPSFGKDSVFHQLEINASLVHQAIAVADTVSYVSGNLFASCATNRAVIIEMTRSTITLRELVRTFIPFADALARVEALRFHRCERRGVGSGNLAVVAS
jgi:hypothetical protein